MSRDCRGRYNISPQSGVDLGFCHINSNELVHISGAPSGEQFSVSTVYSYTYTCYLLQHTPSNRPRHVCRCVSAATACSWLPGSFRTWRKSLEYPR